MANIEFFHNLLSDQQTPKISPLSQYVYQKNFKVMFAKVIFNQLERMQVKYLCLSKGINIMLWNAITSSP